MTTRIESPRRSTQRRTTGETDIQLRLDLDGPSSGDDGVGKKLEVPDGFFAHMLDALVTHSGLGVELLAEGDVDVDLHHTVEDVGIALGDGLREALGDHRGITRFAHAYAPLDEALARAVVDISGRGFFVWTVPSELAHIWVTRDFPLSLVSDFFQAFADRGRFTLHLEVLAARNGHHAAEAAFKATALALRSALARRSGVAAVPSTKGTLSA